jgi:DNA-binding NarL/FixJ family response regulator
VLVIDISMPILDGFQAVSQLDDHCRTKVVILTIHSDHSLVEASFAAGASAYVVKSDLNAELIPAICEALEGRRYIFAVDTAIATLHCSTSTLDCGIAF